MYILRADQSGYTKILPILVLLHPHDLSYNLTPTLARLPPVLITLRTDLLYVIDPPTLSYSR